MISEKRISTLSLIAIFIVASFFTISYWQNLEGDPAILFSFMKYFWQKPFSFGTPDQVLFGATSPAYAVLGSCFQIFTRDIFITFYAIKLISVAMMALSIYMCARVAHLFINKSKVGTTKPHFNLILLFAGCCFFFNAHLFYNSTFLYESFLVLFYTSWVIYSSYINKEKRSLFSIFILSFGYLVRPELIVVQSLSFLPFLKDLVEKKNYKKITASIIIFIIPILIYHLYMHHHTGLWIPTSVQSRFARYQQLQNFEQHYLFAFSHWKFLIVSFSFSCIYFIKPKVRIFSKLDYIFFGAPLILVLFIFIKNGSVSFPIRYFDFSAPFILTLMTTFLLEAHTLNHENSTPLSKNGLIYITPIAGLALYLISDSFIFGIHQISILKTVIVFFEIILIYLLVRYLKKQLAVVALTVIAMHSTIYMFKNGWFNPQSKIQNRFDKEFGEKINKLLKPNDVLALYEVELQYFIDRKIISMDGIVGEPLFLKKNLEEILNLGKINYIGIDHHLYDEGRGDVPFISELYYKGKNLALGDSIVIKGFKFTKVLEDDGFYSYRMWRYIYKIEKV